MTNIDNLAEMRLKAADLAQVLGVSRNAVCQWVEHGLPFEGTPEHRRFTLASWFAWYRQSSAKRREVAQEKIDAAAELAGLRRAQRLLKEHELAVKSGETVCKTEATKEFWSSFDRLRNNVLAAIKRTARELNPNKPERVGKPMLRAVKQCFKQFESSPNESPGAMDAPDDNEESEDANENGN